MRSAGKVITLLGSMLALFDASAAERASVDQVFQQHVRAVQERDMAALERTITSGDALTLILPNGAQTSTRREYLDFHRKFFSSRTWKIRFDPVSRIVGPEFAILTTLSTYEDTEDGKTERDRSWVTFVFQLERGEWRLIHDQNTASREQL